MNHLPSSLDLKPTPKQVRAITKLASELHISTPIENTPHTRREARDLIFLLRMWKRKEEQGE